MVERIQPNSVQKVIKVINLLNYEHFNATDIYNHTKMNYNTIKKVLQHLLNNEYLEYDEIMMKYKIVVRNEDEYQF